MLYHACLLFSCIQLLLKIALQPIQMLPCIYVHHTYRYTHIHTHTQTHTSTRTHTHGQLYTQTHRHTYMYMYILSFIHSVKRFIKRPQGNYSEAPQLQSGQKGRVSNDGHILYGQRRSRIWGALVQSWAQVGLLKLKDALQKPLLHTTKSWRVNQIVQMSRLRYCLHGRIVTVKPVVCTFSL